MHARIIRAKRMVNSVDANLQDTRDDFGATAVRLVCLARHIRPRAFFHEPDRTGQHDGVVIPCVIFAEIDT